MILHMRSLKKRILSGWGGRSYKDLNEFQMAVANYNEKRLEYPR